LSAHTFFFPLSAFPFLVLIQGARFLMLLDIRFTMLFTDLLSHMWTIPLFSPAGSSYSCFLFAKCFLTVFGVPFETHVNSFCDPLFMVPSLPTERLQVFFFLVPAVSPPSRSSDHEANKPPPPCAFFPLVFPCLPGQWFSL